MFWIVLWTVALIWFLSSNMFNTTENIGLIIVWVVMVGATVYVLFQNAKAQKMIRPKSTLVRTDKPTLNAACPCGSGKKFKRCCGAT